MRLLVTGAGGLLGRHVASAAAARGIDLVVTARREPETLPPGARFRQADLSDSAEAESLVRETRPTHLVHAAWETRQPTYWHDMANLRWVESAARMGAAFAEAGGERFVLLGSCAEYDWAQGLCVENVTPDRPATRYGRAKLAAFRAVEAAAHGAFEAAEARIFFVYGPGENEARFIPYICRTHAGGGVPELSSGRQWRDLLHAEDAAEALLGIAVTAGLEGVVNVGGGEPRSLAEAATILAAEAGAAETGLGRRPDREGDPLFLVASADRLRSTGWRPSVSLEEGLARTYRWWRDRQGAL